MQGLITLFSQQTVGVRAGAQRAAGDAPTQGCSVKGELGSRQQTLTLPTGRGPPDLAPPDPRLPEKGQTAGQTQSGQSPTRPSHASPASLAKGSPGLGLLLKQTCRPRGCSGVPLLTPATVFRLEGQSPHPNRGAAPIWAHSTLQESRGLAPNPMLRIVPQTPLHTCHPCPS